MQQISQQQLKELFDYREDGNLVRIKTTQGFNAQIGCVLGSKENPRKPKRNNRYSATTLNGARYKVHQLIYLYHNGYIPKALDHVNGNTFDNRIENLRPVTTTENAQNRKKPVSNTSGIKGVTWNKNLNSWKVRIGVNDKRLYLGDFKDLELAELVANEARNKYHGKYANNF